MIKQLQAEKISKTIMYIIVTAIFFIPSIVIYVLSNMLIFNNANTGMEIVLIMFSSIYAADARLTRFENSKLKDRIETLTSLRNSDKKLFDIALQELTTQITNNFSNSPNEEGSKK